MPAFYSIVGWGLAGVYTLFCRFIVNFTMNHIMSWRDTCTVDKVEDTYCEANCLDSITLHDRRTKSDHNYHIPTTHLLVRSLHQGAV